MVPKATTTNTNAIPIAATLENSGTDGVGSVLPSGVNTAWYANRFPYPWLTLYGLSVGVAVYGYPPWLRFGPEMIQCEKTQPLSGIAVSSSDVASAKA